MFSQMVWLALLSGALAIAAALFVGGRFLLANFGQIRRTGLQAVIKAWLTVGILRPMLARLGRWLLPFITWNQRHRLTQLLLRSASIDLDYAQMFAARVLLSLLGVVIYLSAVGLGSIQGRVMRAELLIDILLCTCLVAFFWWLPILWLKQRYRQRLIAIERSLPFF